MIDMDPRAGRTQEPDIHATLEALKSHEEGTPSAAIFYGLSGLGEAAVRQIEPVWNELAAEKRRRIMSELVEASESNWEMDYRSIGLLGLDDEDAGVRQSAIEVLWEDETLELMRRLIGLVRKDPSPEVRAAAASTLGRFIYEGELGHLPETEIAQAQQAVIEVYNDKAEASSVRRRALEAIANSSHPIVAGAIRESYHSTDPLMHISSLFAMGRSCDSQWADIVLTEIDSADAEVRYEAARAAGELELKKAVPKLARLTLEDDPEILLAAVWSLGEIGGKEAMRVLEALAEKAEEEEDDDLLEAVEDAIGSASLAGDDLLMMGFMDDDDE
jgi:HEAT repeat protein